MTKRNNCLIFFTRIPEEGTTKTRLIPFLGAKKASDFQLMLIKDVYKNLESEDYDITVSYDGKEEKLKEFKRNFPGVRKFLKQRGSGLGEKMYTGIAEELKDYEKVVLIGSDLPFVTRETIEEAFFVLKDRDVVIGETEDGGYYLIGMKEPYKELFKMVYGGGSVFEETVKRIVSLGLSYGEVKKTMDVDEKADLLSLKNVLDSGGFILENTESFLKELEIDFRKNC